MARGRRIDRDIDESFEQETRKLEARVKKAVASGLQELDSISPVWSGYYQSNHRVSINDTNVALVPATKPEDTNWAQGLGELTAENLVNREWTIIDKFKFGDDIYVANAVPYADEIEVEGTTTAPEGLYYRRAAQKVKVELGGS